MILVIILCVCGNSYPDIQWISQPGINDILFRKGISSHQIFIFISRFIL